MHHALRMYSLLLEICFRLAGRVKEHPYNATALQADNQIVDCLIIAESNTAIFLDHQRESGKSSAEIAIQILYSPKVDIVPDSPSASDRLAPQIQCRLSDAQRHSEIGLRSLAKPPSHIGSGGFVLRVAAAADESPIDA